MEIKQHLTQYNHNKGTAGRIKYIVIHYVGALGGALANCRYYAGGSRGASAHYFVGFDGEIYQSVLDQNIAWHCGAKSYKHAECRNANSIGIEMCVRKSDTGHLSGTDKDWYFEDATVESAAGLTRYLMEKYNIPADRVLRHYDVTGKICPNPYVYNTGKHTWDEFKRLVIIGSSGASTGTGNTGPGAAYKYKVGDRVMVSTHYKGADDPIDKHVVVNPQLAMRILDIVQGARNPYHTDFNTYINDGDIRGYAPAVQAQPAVSKTTAHPVIMTGQMHCNNFVGAGLDTDGVRGSKTKAGGVKCVQHACNLDYKSGLVVDGAWGNKSESALGKHYVKKGETQYLVTAVEILLMLKGYDPKGVECPGQFAGGLEACVMQYQKDNGLKADGIAGPATLKSLMS